MLSLYSHVPVSWYINWLVTQFYYVTGSVSKHFWVLQTRMIHFPRTLQSTGRQMKQKLLKQVLSIMFHFSSLVYIGILAPCNFKSFMANGSRGLTNLSLCTELRKFSLFHPFVILLYLLNINSIPLTCICRILLLRVVILFSLELCSKGVDPFVCKWWIMTRAYCSEFHFSIACWTKCMPLVL